MTETNPLASKTSEELQKRRDELFFSVGQDQFHKEFLIGKLVRDNQEILGINNELYARGQAEAAKKANGAEAPAITLVPEVVTEATSSV